MIQHKANRIWTVSNTQANTSKIDARSSYNSLRRQEQTLSLLQLHYLDLSIDSVANDTKVVNEDLVSC